MRILVQCDELYFALHIVGSKEKGVSSDEC